MAKVAHLTLSSIALSTSVPLGMHPAFKPLPFYPHRMNAVDNIHGIMRSCYLGPLSPPRFLQFTNNCCWRTGLPLSVFLRGRGRLVLIRRLSTRRMAYHRLVSGMLSPLCMSSPSSSAVVQLRCGAARKCKQRRRLSVAMHGALLTFRTSLTC